MKKYSLYLVGIFVSTLATMLLSWNRFNYSNKGLTPSLKSYFHDQDYSDLTETELSAFDVDDKDEYFSPDSNYRPAAEDVLVKRIPKDDYHLLMMAFYSKENYSKATFIINEDGTEITFRDDGKGYDKKAGDGFYTALVTEDVPQFKQQAINLVQEMKRTGFQPYHFVNSQSMLDPDATENFDLQKFDANETVSISGLTNAKTSNLAAAKTNNLDTIKKNSVFITDIRVVEDTTRTWNYCTQKGNVNGPWTFGTLMRQLASTRPDSIASDSTVSAFVINWLHNWDSTLVINGDTVAKRTNVDNQIITPWLTKSLAGGAPLGQLDMRFAPFKLTAISNRFDLRSSVFTTSPCGEGRLVFCLIKSDCTTFLRMNVIFEYGIKKPGTCTARKDWAQQWVNLTNFVRGSAEYNQALQNITDQFTLCGTNPSNINQSSLDQIRTNEVTLSPTPATWELREFHLDVTNNLKETTLPQTPADKYNARVVNADVKRMVAFVNKNAKAIKAGTKVVPLIWQNQPFLAAKTHVFGQPTGQPPGAYHWDGTDSTNLTTFITDAQARFSLSLNTCSGCHSGEPQTGFTQVDPVFFGKEATLSGFLTGRPGGGGAIDFDNNPTNDTMTVKDAALRPSANPTIRTFLEIRRRAGGLNSFATKVCTTTLSISSELMFQPLNSVD